LEKENLMKRRLVMCCILAILLVGCATTVDIRSDGIPLPNHVVRLSNPELDLTATFSFCRYYRHYEDDEFILFPEYLPFFKSTTIYRANTARIELAGRIYNPKRVKYRLVAEIVMREFGKKQPRTVSQILYEGKLSTRDFVYDLPMAGNINNVEAEIKVLRPDGYPIMIIGKAVYSLEDRESARFQNEGRW
jgi:hypothetical protein